VSVVPQPDDEGGEDTLGAPPAHTDVAALYARYHPRLLRHAHSVLTDHPDLAQDALMTVFSRLLRRQHEGKLTEQPNWEAYLLRAVRNACLDLLDASEKAHPVEEPAPDAATQLRAPADPTGDAVAQRLDDAAKRRRVSAALTALPPRLRQIVIQKTAHGRTNADIGRELGLTGQRIGQLHDQAIRQLREEVNRHDG
jgi:RNA polymerase sigma factor (sigma-70 family)